MSLIEQRKQELIAAILGSEPYQRYLSARNQLQQSPEKLEKTKELRKRNFELQGKESGGVFSPEMETFTYEMEVSRRDEEIEEYFAAELHMCRILQEIFKDVVNHIDLDLDFLD